MKYKKMRVVLVKITENHHILGEFGGLLPFTILKLPTMYCYISTLIKHIDLTINLIN